MPIAVVYKENTLGLLSESFGQPCIEVLNGLVGRGGISPMNSPILFVKESEYRQATLADLDRLRVVHNEAYLVDES